MPTKYFRGRDVVTNTAISNIAKDLRASWRMEKANQGVEGSDSDSSSQQAAKSEDEGEKSRAVPDEPHQMTRLKKKKVQSVCRKKMEGHSDGDNITKLAVEGDKNEEDNENWKKKLEEETTRVRRRSW